jgi:hypothetical protein
MDEWASKGKKGRNADDLRIIRDTGTRAYTDSATRSALLGRFEDLDDLLGTIWEALDVARTLAGKSFLQETKIRRRKHWLSLHLQRCPTPLGGREDTRRREHVRERGGARGS